MVHPRADVDRLYIPRMNGSSGQRQIDESYNPAFYRIAHYIILNAEKHPAIATVKFHHNRKQLFCTILTNARRIAESYKDFGDNSNQRLRTTHWMTHQIKVELEKNVKSKPMYGQLQHQMSELDTNVDMSHNWLSPGNIKGETESLNLFKR